MVNTKNNINADVNFERLIRWVIISFFVAFPFVNFQGFLYGGTSTRAVSLIAFTSALGIAFAVWLFRNRGNVAIPVSPIFISLISYFVFVVISGMVGLDPHTSFWSVVTRMAGVWYFIHLGVFMYFVWWLMKNDSFKDKLILSIILSSALYSILSFLGPEGLGWLFRGYLGDGFTFGNSTFAAMYIFGAFMLSIYYLFQAPIKKWWMFALLVVLVINPNIINRQIWFGDFSNGLVGEARATTYAILISVFALCAVWLISKIKAEKTRSVVVYSIFLVSVFGAIFSAHSLLSRDGFLRKIYLAESTAARPLVWEMSEKAIIQRPWLGWGTDNFERVFEKNYDNRLLQGEYGNEAWFDRAHNVFIDQAVDNGMVGLTLYILVYLVILLCLIFTALKSPFKNDKILASILIVYFPLHFAELQTAFDTTISYPMLALMTVLAVVIFDRAIMVAKGKSMEFVAGRSVKYTVAAGLSVFLVWSLFWGLFPFVSAQITNGYIRTVGDPEKRIPEYKKLFASPVDQHAFLWRTSTDFQRGIAEYPKVLSDPKKNEGLKKEIVIFENGYREYLKKNPESFRAHLNLADTLIYQRLFEVNKLEEAQKVLDEAIALVPQSPQSYWMKAVAYIYMKKFDQARAYAQKGLALNPKIKQSQEIVNYVETSIKNFPNVDLFFFRQI